MPAAPGPALAVSPGRPAAVGDGRALAAVASVAESAPRLVVGLASARALTPVAAESPAPAPPPEAPVAQTSPAVEPEPSPPPSPEPVATTVATPAPQTVAVVPVRVPYAPGFQPGPTTAGVEPPPAVPAEPLEVHEGDEGSLSFRFGVEPTSYLAPGEDNPILRFADPAGEAPTFALQLWDDGAGQRGLWASGAAAGGERFLAPLSDGLHGLTVYFVASGEEDGLYLVSLDGLSVDTRAWVSLLPASGAAWVEAGL